MTPRLSILLLLFLIGSAFPVIAHSSEDGARLVSECSIYSGEPCDDVQKVVASSEFSLLSGGVPNLGLTDNWHYVRFDVKAGDYATHCFVGNSSIDHIELYDITGSAQFLESKGSAILHKGSMPTPSGYAFKLQRNPGIDQHYLLRLKSGKQLIAPISIGSDLSIMQKAGSEDSMMSLYFGIIAVLFFYNIFLAFATKEKGYANYSFYLLSIALTQAVLFGYGSTYLWPGSVWLGQNAVHLMGALSGITTIFFAINFLSLKHYTPIIHKVLIGYAVLYCASLLFCFAGQSILSYNLINFCAASSILLIVASVKAKRKGNRSAGFFLLAWSVFIVACTIFAMKDFGVLPYNTWTVYALPFGSAIEGVLLSFALADKINLLRKEKEEADAQRLKTIQTQNELLETKVQQRTAQLAEAKDYIQSQYDHLRLTQKQLVESEKLAGLGQMTAGIAHELNNPINFVTSNVGPLQRDIDDLLSIIDDYEALGSAPDANELNTVRARSQELDIQFVRKEIQQLLKGIDEGSRRTAEIVRGLRIFARTDKDTLISANINECINSTIVVMKSVTKGHVTVVKDMREDMPEIDCFPGKLNQVIVNLISNAIQATRIPGRTEEQRTIHIRSTFDNDYVTISVSDNGCGIDPQEMEKIFVPFYTTKAVGEGTGLGLSIARGIMDQHLGKIEVVSERGKGTEFILHLPRNRNQATNQAA